MQYITNTSKGGISYVANNLEPIYGRVSNRKSIFTCIDSLVTHYDRDLARALLLSLFGITAGIKIHIVHVNPINLTKFKFVIRSFASIFVYKLAALLKWKFIFISRENYADYHRFVPSQYIANPILKDLRNISPRALNLKDNIKFVNMGRFDFQKSQARCLDFIELMERNFPQNNFEYHFYGDGKYLEMFMDIVSKTSFKGKIFFKEWAKEVLVELDKYDIYLQSSLWEGLPTIVVEALDSGLRVISFPLSSSASLLSDASYVDANFDFESFLFRNVGQPSLKKYLIKESLEKHLRFYEEISILNL